MVILFHVLGCILDMLDDLRLLVFRVIGAFSLKSFLLTECLCSQTYYECIMWLVEAIPFFDTQRNKYIGEGVNYLLLMTMVGDMGHFLASLYIMINFYCNSSNEDL